MSTRLIGARAVLETARTELAASASKMQGFRPRRTFTKFEIAHGFAAFIRLVLELRRLGDTGRNWDSSMAAREAALQHVQVSMANTVLAEQVRAAGLPFHAAREVAWGYARAEHEAWNFSVTRAIILLCRGLAYRLQEGQPGAKALAHQSTDPELYATFYQLLNEARRELHSTYALNGIELLLTANLDAEHPMLQITQPLATFRCPGFTRPPESVDGVAPPCNHIVALPKALGTLAALCPSCGSLHVVLEHADTTLDVLADAHTVGPNIHLYSISTPMQHRAAAWFAHETVPGATLVDWMIANTPHMWPHRALWFADDDPNTLRSMTITTSVLTRSALADLTDYMSVLDSLEAAARRALASHQHLLAFALLHRIVTFRPVHHHSHELYWHVHRSIFRPAA